MSSCCPQEQQINATAEHEVTLAHSACKPLNLQQKLQMCCSSVQFSFSVTGRRGHLTRRVGCAVQQHRRQVSKVGRQHLRCLGCKHLRGHQRLLPSFQLTPRRCILDGSHHLQAAKPPNVHASLISALHFSSAAPTAVACLVALISCGPELTVTHALRML